MWKGGSDAPFGFCKTLLVQIGGWGVDHGEVGGTRKQRASSWRTRPTPAAEDQQHQHHQDHQYQHQITRSPANSKYLSSPWYQVRAWSNQRREINIQQPWSTFGCNYFMVNWVSVLCFELWFSNPWIGCQSWILAKAWSPIYGSQIFLNASLGSRVFLPL